MPYLIKPPISSGIDKLIEEAKMLPDVDETRDKDKDEISGQETQIRANAPGLQTSLDYWTIPGVEYRNGIYTVNLAKTLLDNGSAKTQEQWAEYSRQAKEKGDFYTGDFPLYHAVFARLFKDKDSQTAKEARKFIQKAMREKYPMTLTKIKYKPAGRDEVVHNYKMPDEYLIQEEIVGPDRKIDSKDSLALTAILGACDINQINAIYNWINQTPAYIWRLNSKPKNIDERVARFNAYSSRVNLGCYGGSEDSIASLGVFGCAEGTHAPK